MVARKSGARAWWPLLLVPLGISLAVLFAGVSTRLSPGETGKEETAPGAAQASPIEDDASIRQRALLALAKLALARMEPEEEETAASTQTGQAPQPPAAAGMALGMLGANDNPENAERLAESKAFATYAYDEVERRIAEQAKDAHVVIAVDGAMQVGRDYTTSLIIEGGSGRDIMPLMKQLPEPAAAELDVEIAPDVEAYASSSQFTIATVTPARQAIRAQAPTVWQWTLTPRRDGEATLMIMLRQNVSIDGQTFSFPVKQFPQVIRVDLTWWLWVRELALSFWGALTALLVAGASGATIYNAFKTRGDKDAGKRPGKAGTRRRPARRAV